MGSRYGFLAAAAGLGYLVYIQEPEDTKTSPDAVESETKSPSQSLWGSIRDMVQKRALWQSTIDMWKYASQRQATRRQLFGLRSRSVSLRTLPTESSLETETSHYSL